MIFKRLRELGLDRVSDPRRAHGRVWALQQLLVATLLGHLSGCRSFAETEELTEELPEPLRARLRLPRRVPDTTLRKTILRLDPDEVRKRLHRQVKAAVRRKQLGHGHLPFGVVAIDGKCTASPVIDDHYSQRQHLTQGGEVLGVQGLVRTLTCCLTSSSSKVCLDAMPIPADTNEVGFFGTAFRELVATYGRTNLFEMVTLDAGFTSAENAALIHDIGYGYLMRLKDERRGLTATAVRLLGHLPESDAVASTCDEVGDVEVTRRIWIESVSEVPGWPHLRRVIRVQSVAVSSDGTTVTHDRYYATNYGAAALTPAQWLAIVRSHWAVENNCHWVFDTAFAEDDRTWVHDPQGMVVISLLRRIAYNMLALYRSVTLRSPDSRRTPWSRLLRAVNRALIRASEASLRRLRRGRLDPATA